MPVVREEAVILGIGDGGAQNGERRRLGGFLESNDSFQLPCNHSHSIISNG